MSDWPRIPLGDIFEIARGGSPRPIDAYITDADDGINWISIADASDSSKYIERTKRRIRPEGASRSRSVVPGDLLLTNSMSFGRPYIMRTTGCIHDGWLVLAKKRDGIDQDFFYHLLGSETVYAAFARLAAGATVKNLNIDLVKGVSVVVPPLPEQRRIAAILDQADALRAKRREALAQLDSLTQSIFIEMFGDPESGRSSVPVTTLGKVCLRITDGTHQSPKWESSGIPFIFISNIVQSQINFDTNKYISEATYHELTRRCPVEVGDVLYTTVGSYGNVAVVSSQKKFAFQRHIAHIKPDRAKLASTFCAAMLRSPVIRRQVDRVARGVAQKTVNLSDLSALRVFEPPMQVQRQFALRADAIESVRASHASSLAELDSLFDSLQHRAFAGQLS